MEDEDLLADSLFLLFTDFYFFLSSKLKTNQLLFTDQSLGALFVLSELLFKWISRWRTLELCWIPSSSKIQSLSNVKLNCLSMETNCKYGMRCIAWGSVTC